MITLTEIYPDKARRFQVLRMLANMRRQKESQPFIDFLNDVVNYIDVMNRTAASPELQWNQGAAQFGAELATILLEAEGLAQQLYDRQQA